MKSMRSVNGPGKAGAPAAGPDGLDGSHEPEARPEPLPETLRIAVIGTGYVGLVTAACLAKFGHRVTAVDIDEQKVRSLQRAEVTIHEEGLQELVRDELAAQRLAFGSDTAGAVRQADLIFIAVGTPARADGSTAMEAMDKVAAELVALVRAPQVVVVKSTVPVGTTARIREAFAQAGDASTRQDGHAPEVLSNPEFLREGSAVEDFLNPDRVIIGSDATDPAARDLLLRAYAPLAARGVAMLTMDTRSAELSKCAANAMLSARISFVNEIAAIAAATGADIEQVRAGIGSDSRIGPDFLRAGLGYGGSCFPKDVAALRHTARKLGLRSDMLWATERVNGRQRSWPFEALLRDLGSGAALRGLRAAVWGLAFKPGTDDMREAPSLALIERLCRAGVYLNLYDPVAMDNARAVIKPDRRLRWCASADETLDQADVLLLVTEWPEFVAFDPARVASTLRLRTVYDGRNALDVEAWTGAGLRLVQVGRPDHGRRMQRQVIEPAVGLGSGFGFDPVSLLATH